MHLGIPATVAVDAKDYAFLTHLDRCRRDAGLGLLRPPADLEEETLKEYSHGDAGVIIVDVSCGDDRDKAEGTLAYFAGYHARHEERAKEYEADGHPGYRAMLEWARGKCFKNLAALEAAYRARTP